MEFYQLFGFEVIKEYEIEDSKVINWSLLRKPNIHDWTPDRLLLELIRLKLYSIEYRFVDLTKTYTLFGSNLFFDYLIPKTEPVRFCKN